MKLRKLAASLAVAAALGVSGTASAGIAVSTALQPGVNTITDNSAELFVNKVGSATTIDVGDIFLGGVQIDKINNQVIGTGGWNELTGVFGVQVIAINPVPNPITGLFDILFAPVGTIPVSGDLQTEFLLQTGIDIGATAAGTFARFFEDDSPDASRDGSSFLNFITETTDGTFWLDTALAPGGLFSAGFVDLTALAELCATSPAGSGVGNFQNLGAGVTVSASTVPQISVGTAVGVSGGVQCPVAPEDFTVRDDATFTVVATVVPEPMTLGLLGLGLLGVGLARRRKA